MVRLIAVFTSLSYVEATLGRYLIEMMEALGK